MFPPTVASGIVPNDPASAGNVASGATAVTDAFLSFFELASTVVELAPNHKAIVAIAKTAIQ
jgi:hypothetical protein